MGKVWFLIWVTLASAGAYFGYDFAERNEYLPWKADRKTECHDGMTYNVVQRLPGSITMVKVENRDDKSLGCTK